MLQQLADRFQIDDTARVNLELAGLHLSAEGLDVEACLRTLDGWARLVGAETERLMYVFRRNPSRFDGSEARFRMMTLATVLQRDLGVHYRQETLEMPDDEFFRRPENLFMHGVILGKGGTCASLPPTFAAVGRRLGYPLRLVKTCQHLFLRWDDLRGERFNVECTSRGFLSHPDEYYRHWPRELPAEMERACGALRSLTSRQETAQYVSTSAGCFAQNGRLEEASTSFARAADMDPEDASHLHQLVVTMNRWDRDLYYRLMPGFPPMRVWSLPRRYPRIPWDLEEGIFHMRAQELVLGDPEWNRRWWLPLRTTGPRPRDLPAFITVRYPPHLGEEIDVGFHDAVPPDFDHANARPC
jgi:hypothetical protein